MFHGRFYCDVWGVWEQAHGRDYELVNPEPVRTPTAAVETAAQFAGRVEKFKDGSKRIWSDIVGCVLGDALIVIKGLDEEAADGRNAFRRLEERMGEAGTSSMFLVLKELLTVKQGSQKIEDHVTKFETIVQKCSGLEIAMNDEVFTVIFPQSPGAAFPTLATVTLLSTRYVGSENPMLPGYGERSGTRQDSRG